MKHPRTHVPPFASRSVGLTAVLLSALVSALPSAARAIARYQPSPVSESDGAKCASCHSCDRPTAADRCLRVCGRSVTSADVKTNGANRGPRIVILDELENTYLPVPFDHAGHANMADMAGGCSKCHHYTPEGQEHPACKSCHSTQSGEGTIDKPGLKGAYHRQCLSCHREWSGDTGCVACHQPKARGGDTPAIAETPSVDDIVGRMHPPIPEPIEEHYTTKTGPDETTTHVLFRHKEHIDRYGLRCAECHHEDNCSRCHGEGKKHEQQVRTFDQHHKPCLECHRNDTCDRCHYPKGASAPPPFDHATTGWPMNRFHQAASCRACHVATPFAKRDRSCMACHSNWKAGEFNHTITGQSLDETHASLDCENCHANLRFDAPPGCGDCHEADEGIAFPTKRPGAFHEPPK